MVTLEDYIEHVDKEIAGLAAASGGLTEITKRLAESIGNIYKNQGEFVKNISPVHNSSKYPIQVGPPEQQIELLERGGWIGDQSKSNEFSSHLVGYFNQGQPGQAITGKECEDRTSVGLVSHPAPVDATSWLYPFSLVVQSGEEIWHALQPGHVNKEFLEGISIADTVAEARGYEIEDERNKRGLTAPIKPVEQFPSTSDIYGNSGNNSYNIESNFNDISNDFNSEYTNKDKRKGRGRRTGKQKVTRQLKSKEKEYEPRVNVRKVINTVNCPWVTYANRETPEEILDKTKYSRR